ncbi:major facilitator superfamily domain-containing protein [Xylariaceae sp. FL0016]|nr:major facilitator superfamily domain-containing protein [Xylariaceae sp. FL0016]
MAHDEDHSATHVAYPDSATKTHESRNEKSNVEAQASTVATLQDGSFVDPNEVGWDGPEDPYNPKNWSVRKKAYTIGIIMSILVTTSNASFAIAPCVSQILQYFHSDNTLDGTLVVSIELMGVGLGPLFLAPLSEMYGRRILYSVSSAAFCVITAGCALAPSLQSLVALRFLQGLAASSSMSQGGGTIGDLVPVHRRGAVMSVYTAALLVGPVIGPIYGGYLAQSRGWQWVFWVLIILNGFIGLVYVLTCRETYGPVLLKWKANRLRKETGNQAWRAHGQQRLPLHTLLSRALVRPTRMLLYSPIVTGLSLYIGAVYGLVYLLLSTFSFVFEGQYHFGESQNGLIYLGLTVGMLISSMIAGIVCDQSYMRLTKKHGREKPEYRLEVLMYGAAVTPAGLLIYGWTTEYNVHAVVPILATSLVGFGLVFTFVPIQVYLIDAYTKYSASAIASAAILRALCGSLLPIAGLPMYNKLGLGWGNTLLASIGLVLAGFPLLFVRVGERWRQKFSVDFD